MAIFFPGIPPCLPLVPNFVPPCAVAPAHWGDASVGGFGKVEVGEGEGGILVATVCETYPFLVGGYLRGLSRRPGEGKYYRESGVRPTIGVSR